MAERDIVISLEVAIQRGGSNVVERLIATYEHLTTASMKDTHDNCKEYAILRTART
jgi:hypothetical protein